MELVVNKSSDAAYCRTGSIAEQIFNGKARAYKHTKKMNVAQSDKVNNIYKLQKLHQKCKYQHADVYDIMVVLTAEK